MRCIDFFRAVAALAIALSIAGCGKERPHRTSSGHELPSPLVASCEPGERGGRLTIFTSGFPRTFNSFSAPDPASETAARLVFSPMLVMDMATQEVGPGLVESWSVAADQKTWTFKLRPGLRWNDGAPLTADDVVFTWNEVIYQPEFNPNGYAVFMLDGQKFSVTKVDDLTFTMTTPAPFAPLLDFLSQVVVLPKHSAGPLVKSRRFITAYSVMTPPEDIVGSGPFRVKEIRPDRHIVLERNPEFWMTDKRGTRLPYLDELMLVAGGTPETRAMFLSGNSDISESIRAEDLGAIQQAAAAGRCTLYKLGAGGACDYFWFNQNTGADLAGRSYVSPAKLKLFRDKKFRHAVSCAIDRDRIVREAYQGQAQTIFSLVPEENRKWFNPDAARDTFDPARARALLGEIGCTDRNGDGIVEDRDGAAVEFTLLTNVENPRRRQSAVIIAENLGSVGIKVSAQALDFAELLRKINGSFDYEAMLIGLGGGAEDPVSLLKMLKSDEPVHQWFPNQEKPSTPWEARMDELMDAQMRTLDFAERKKAFDEVQKIFADELPMIPTVAPFHYAAARTDLANVRPATATPYCLTWNVQELFFKK